LRCDQITNKQHCEQQAWACQRPQYRKLCSADAGKQLWGTVADFKEHEQAHHCHSQHLNGRYGQHLSTEDQNQSGENDHKDLLDINNPLRARQIAHGLIGRRHKPAGH
jgi:hypothetical protein